MVKTSDSGQEPRTRETGDWAASFEHVEFSWAVKTPDEQSGSGEAAVAEPEAGPAEGPPAEEPPALTRRIRRARRARRRIVIASVVVTALVVCGAAAAVALLRRDSGTETRSRASTAASSTPVTTTTVAPTTVPPTTMPTTAAPSTAAAAPGAFTVRATCGGRDCTVAVHREPKASTARVAALRTGEVVQVSCSTHGEAVTDRDTGQRSDVWNRLADGSYASALYLEGPTVPDCR